MNGDSLVFRMLLGGDKLEPIIVTRSQVGVCQPTLRNRDADTTGSLLQSFSRRWVATQRLEATWDSRIVWTPRSVDREAFLNGYIGTMLDMGRIRSCEVRFSHIG